MLTYHVSPVENRASIQRAGLAPRDTTKFHFGDEASLNAGVEAVYVHETMEAARGWAKGPASYTYASDVDIWAAQTDGLPVEHDPYRERPSAYLLRTSLRVLAHIDAARVELVLTINA